MSARRVLAITRRLLQQFRRDRRTLALLFVAPLVILSLLSFLLRGGGDRPAVGVVVEDPGPLGAAIARQLDRSGAVDARRLDLATARAQLADGRLAAFVVLPSNLTQTALDSGAIAVDVEVEGSQPGQSGQVVQAVGMATAATAAALAPPGTSLPRLEPRVTYLHGGPALDTLDYFGGAFVGVVVFFLVFVITCVAFLRERAQGTLERLMASPLRRGEIVIGYMLAFTLLALVQSVEVQVFALGVLRIHNSGSVLVIFVIVALLALVAVNLGIFLSTFARTEFQAVQFIPLVVVPQVLLGGVLLPVASEPGWLQGVSGVLPLTYAVNGLRDVMLKGAGPGSAALQLDVAVVLGFGLLALAGAAATLRRRIA